MNSLNKLNRRSVLSFAVLASGLALLGSVGQKAIAAAAKLKLIDLSKKDDPAVKSAAGLNYVAKTEEALKKPALKKQMEEKAKNFKVEAAKQNCANCQFYASVEENKAGKCTLIQNVLVHNTGWCTSWIKHATYKPDAPAAK